METERARADRTGGLDDDGTKETEGETHDGLRRRKEGTKEIDGPGEINGDEAN
jgi:hypothetical protein